MQEHRRAAALRQVVKGNKLTSKQQEIYDFIAARGEECTPEQIAEVYFAERAWPKNWRGMILAFMRDLIMRSSIVGLREVTRSTSLGRSAKAAYQLKKD